MKAKIGRKSIYPLTEGNLNALLLNFFPQYPQGILSNYLEMYKDIGVSLKDLELCCSAITNYLEELESHSTDELTRCSISRYAIDIYFQPNWPHGVLSSYKQTLSKMIDVVES